MSRSKRDKRGGHINGLYHSGRKSETKWLVRLMNRRFRRKKFSTDQHRHSAKWDMG